MLISTRRAHKVEISRGQLILWSAHKQIHTKTKKNKIKSDIRSLETDFSHITLHFAFFRESTDQLFRESIDKFQTVV